MPALLALRAQAVIRHDTAALARTAAASATSGVRELGQRTAALPLTRWRYVVESDGPGPTADERRVSVRLAYRLDSDQVDIAARRVLLVTRATSATTAAGASPAASGWVVLSDDPMGAGLPWDLGTLSYARGSHGSVVAVAAAAGVAALVVAADAADAAEAAVTRVWGTGWSRQPVVVAVSGPKDLAMLTGRTAADVSGLVAISTTDRVFLDLTAYATLSTAGRQVLLTHEVTHVATAAGSDPRVPQWLKEGFADYVGFQHSGISVAAAAASLLAGVRRSGPPAALPADADFHGAAAGGGNTLGDAYSGSWLACSLLADTMGTKALVAVYRATSAGSADPVTNVDRALRTVTGRSLSQWTSAWRADLTRLTR